MKDKNYLLIDKHKIYKAIDYPIGYTMTIGKKDYIVGTDRFSRLCWIEGPLLPRTY